MNFLSIGFWLAFCVFFLVYICFRQWSRKAMLLWVIAFDLFFFWKANGWLMLLLPATAAVNYFLTEAMRRARRGRGWLLTLTILADLSALVYFKYSGFFVEGILNPLLNSNFAVGDIVLPIGISFYTFQAISYSVDVYRGKYDGHPDFLEFCFYLSFFPLLLAGPITRAGRFLPQIRRAEPATRHELRLGLWLIILGLLKKGVLADYLAVYNNLAFDSPSSYSGYELLMAAVGYTMQIYLDFSGYSDLSIGIASLMGFRLDDNFLFPYRSLNLTEFWRRWHISLMSWFRDYLYIPLGGSRGSRGKTVRNVFIVFLLSGLWHGANWTFLAWGAYNAVLFLPLILSGSTRKFRDDIAPGRLLPSWKEAFRMLLTFVLVTLGWIIFRADTLPQAADLFLRMWRWEPGSGLDFLLNGQFLIRIPGIAAVLAVEWMSRTDSHALNMKGIRSRAARYLVYAVLCTLIFLFADNTAPNFIYFQF